MQTGLHVCIPAHACMLACMHACIHTNLPTHKPNLLHAYIRTHTHTYTYTCMYSYIPACMHACMRACMHTYTHTYRHTYIIMAHPCVSTHPLLGVSLSYHCNRPRRAESWCRQDLPARWVAWMQRTCMITPRGPGSAAR